MRKVVYLSLIMSALLGCATKPEMIAAADVPVEKYQTFTCDELAIQLSRAKYQVSKYTRMQNKKLGIDSWVSIMTIVPPSKLTGDYEKDIALFKGEVNAIEATQMAKQCSQ